jgi:hypothetical protein
MGRLVELFQQRTDESSATIKSEMEYVHSDDAEFEPDDFVEF